MCTDAVIDIACMLVIASGKYAVDPLIDIQMCCRY